MNETGGKKRRGRRTLFILVIVIVVVGAFALRFLDIRRGESLASIRSVQEQEGKLLLKQIKPGDYMILLDERGREFHSIAFAEYLNGLQGRVKHLSFVIGGPYGFSEEVYGRADGKFSLSKLTFSHQLVRVIFMEQLYRAYTILKGEPYHHA